MSPRTTELSIESTDLDLRVEVYPTGWQVALQRPPEIKVAAPLQFEPLDVPVLSLGFSRLQPKVRSFSFARPVESALVPAPANVKPKPKPKPPGTRAASKRTRIAPPKDTIKLQDRLYYLLQPPLESFVQASSLGLPFEPFPYQYDGIAFLYPRYAAVLADEMGLGKTMQAINTIRLLVFTAEARRILLVCPKPLVSNWQREFSLWAPELTIAVIEGDRAKREWQWEQVAAPVKIANYELLMRDQDIIHRLSEDFDLVVLDEAQRIKNRSSTTSQVARSIPRVRSWALTGTPVENSPEDLVGVFEFLLPGLLNSNMAARRMGQLAGDYVLRRTKDMVLEDLPPKLYRDAELSLSPDQAESYHVAEKDGVVRLESMGTEMTIQHVFELVLRLKQICNFDPLTGASSKTERLVADLEEVAASGKKALVFSQWVHTIERLAERLEPFSPLQYHGKIPSKKRDGVIEQFRDDPRHHVLLISYGAGSVGLNLQFCGYVFLFDRWWNPAVEDQAINRAHRIGAAGPVTVTRMLTMATIEERINQVLEEKRQLFQAIFAETGTPPRMGLSQEEIFGLFDLRKQSKAA